MKVYCLNKLFGFLIWLSLAFSCASFPPRQEPSTTFLNTNNINLLKGNYAIDHTYSNPTKDTTIAWNFSHSDLGRYPTFFDELNNGIFIKGIRKNSSKVYTFSINSISAKKLKISYYENDSVIKQNKIRYNLKDDGYLYLKQRNFKVIGFPYLLGALKLKRSRITLNNENNLLFETSEVTTGGAILFYLFVPVFKSKYEKTYPRIE